MDSVSEQENQITPVLLVHLNHLPGCSELSELAPVPGWSLTTSKKARTPRNDINEIKMFESNQAISRSAEDNKAEGKSVLEITGPLHVQHQ